MPKGNDTLEKLEKAVDGMLELFDTHSIDNHRHDLQHIGSLVNAFRKQFEALGPKAKVENRERKIRVLNAITKLSEDIMRARKNIRSELDAVLAKLGLKNDGFVVIDLGPKRKRKKKK